MLCGASYTQQKNILQLRGGKTHWAHTVRRKREINLNTNEKLQKLILQYGLGKKVTKIQPVSGGLSHKTYRVQTDKTDLAIKQLNPAIMRQKAAYHNFVFSEKVARTAKQHGINAVCALQFGGDVVLHIENGYFMVFEWLNAQTITAQQVQQRHCEVIGQTLAEIHNINFANLQNCKPQNVPTQTFDYESYICPAKAQNKPYARRLANDLNLLLALNKLSANATNNLNGALTVSHGDLDCKNVMWQRFTPFVIDWEASGFVHPTAELVQVAWYWAGGDVENLDKHKFETLLNAYVKEYRGNVCPAYADLVYANAAPKLGWLNYNLQRALAKTKSKSTQLADNEVAKSLAELEYCVDQADNVIAALKNCL